MSGTVFSNFVVQSGCSLEDNISLSFKYNIGELSEEEICGTNNDIAFYVKLHSRGTHMWYSGGRHDCGTASVPHYHLHFVVQHWEKDKNESRRRTQSVKCPGLSCKFSTINDVDALEKHMAYPMKENKPFMFTHRGILQCIVNMPENVVQYLAQFAVALYEAKKANDLKRHRASERSGTIQQQLLDLVGDKQFNNYKEYKEYIYPGYYKGLELHEYPDTGLFIKEVGKVAIFKKIVPPWFFDKN